MINLPIVIDYPLFTAIIFKNVNFLIQINSAVI